MKAVERLTFNVEKRIEHEYKGRTVAVVGGAGFLGSWICEALVNVKATVHCFDNFSTGSKSNIFHLFDYDNFKFLQTDVGPEQFFMQGKVDYVLYLADRSSAAHIEKYPIQIWKANVLGIYPFLGVARAHKAKFLYASSSLVYGKPEVNPVPESYNGCINPTNPADFYAEAKRSAEAYVIANRAQRGLDVKIARIFDTYGPRMQADSIYAGSVAAFIEQSLRKQSLQLSGDGAQPGSLCFVSDMVEGILQFLAMDDGAGTVLNLGSSEAIQMAEVASIINRLTSSSSRIFEGPEPASERPFYGLVPDITSAKELLGWTPRTKLEDGLRETIERCPFNL